MPVTSPRRAARGSIFGRFSQALTSSKEPQRSAPRRALIAEEIDRPTSGLSRTGVARARAARIGAVGLATLALLSSASFADRTQFAEPAARTTAAVPASDPSVDYPGRTGRADRSDRETTRSTPSAAKKSSSTKPSAKKKSSTAKKPTSKSSSTAKKSTSTGAAAPKAVGSRYTRVDLNVRAEPAENAKLLSVLDSGSKVTVASTSSGQWQSVVFKGALGWVKKQYLVTQKPTASRSGSGSSGSGSSGSGSSGSGSWGSGAGSNGVCAGGSSVESGLTPDAIKVHRAVCAQFPQISSYGGVRADSLPEHPSGRAIDCMLANYSSASGNALGWQIANWLRGNAGRLGISQILFDQKIWTVQRGGEGWRFMSSRGGATANHRDHVHVTVYGSAATG